jgi:O-antigen ligase/tetratricopeptide (TPR) repeat protein
MRSRDRLTMTAGLAALAVGVLAIGGASRWVVVVLAGLAAAAAASQIRSRRKLAATSPLLVMIGTAVVLTAIQLVPLPDSIGAMVAPAHHELVVDGASLEHAATSIDPQRVPRNDDWRPLSMDPANTWVELAELAALFLIAWMALRAAASERGRQRLLAGVAAIAGAVAVIGIIHELLGATALYGFFEPEHAHPVILAPLLNANHLACLMSLGALVAGGLALAERRSPPVRAMWVVVAVLCIGVLMFTTSRGGVMGLAAGTTVTAVILVLQRLRDAPETKRRDVIRVTVPAAIVVLCTVVLVIYLGGGQVGSQLEETSLDEIGDPRSKYAAWGSALTLLEEAPLLGVGRGGFEAAFTRVHPASAHVTFSHVENEYLQAAVDWGLIGAGALVIGLGWAVLVVVRRWRDGPLVAASIGGIAAVGVHSLVDFGIELPGVAIPTTIVAATVLYVPLRESSRSRRQTLVRGGAIAGAVGAALVAATPIGRTLDEDHAALRAEPPTLAEARAAFERHPLDYVAAAALAKASGTDRERLAYFNHALRLHPTHPGLHRAIARYLAATGRSSQAALEFRLALAGTDDPGVIVVEILAFFPATADAVAALPTEYRHWSAMVDALIRVQRNDVALAFLEKLIGAEGARPSLEVWRRMATLSEAAGNLALAERAAIALSKYEPSVAATVAVAELQVKQRAFDRAQETLARVTSEVPTTKGHVDAWVLSCEIHMAVADWPKAQACLDQTLQLAAVTMDLRRKIHGDLAKVYDALGNKTQADFNRQLAAPGRLKSDQPGTTIDGSGRLR